MSAALADHLRDQARSSGSEHSRLRRQFAYDRLLARVFAEGGGDWVLKGGTALLARDRHSRHTLDIDLAYRTGDVSTAVDDVTTMIVKDLGDHFRFSIRRTDMQAHRQGQPGTSQAKLTIDAFVGTTPFETFTLDVVTGSVMTAAPEPVTPSLVVEFDGLVPPTYLLYPVVDHIADKVCATVETHGSAKRPSTRARDLVDLVVIARTHSIEAGQLHTAIEAERQHRGLAPIAAFVVPSNWDRLYAKEAKSVLGLDDYRTLAGAEMLACRFLDPVLGGRRTSGTWSPQELEWS